MGAVAGAEHLIAWARAQQIQALAGLTRMPVWPAWLSASAGPDDWGGNKAIALAEAELAASLSWSRWQAGQRIAAALESISFPEVMARLEAGHLDEGQARAITTTIGSNLTRDRDDSTAEFTERRARVEDRVLHGNSRTEPADDACDINGAVVRERRTASQLREDALPAVLEVDPDAAEKRRQAAIKDREVRMYARADGMAGIEATLSAESASRIDQCLTLLADAARDQDRASARTQDDPNRYVAECDMDDWTGPSATECLHIPAWWQPPHLPIQQRRRAHIVITLHIDTLLGLNDLSAELAGYGAITAQAAPDIARQAGSADLLILGRQPQPAQTSQPPSPDRVFGQTPQTGYRPSNPLVRQVITQHQTCRAPSCTRPAEQCDVDHVIPYAEGGETSALNLIPLCRRHHLLKTFAGWTVCWAGVGEGPPGTLRWTSPLGRHFIVPPNPRPGSDGLG